MNKIFVIGRTEYLQTVRSKGFLIGIFLMPLLMGGSLFFQLLVKDKVDLEPRRAVVMDATGELFAGLMDANEKRSEEDIWSDVEGEEDKQVRPRFEFEAWSEDEQAPIGDAAEDRQAMTVRLSERVRAGELQGFFLIGAEVFNVEKPTDDVDPIALAAARSMSYYTDEPTYKEMRSWVSGVLNKDIKDARFKADNLDSEVKARVEQLSANVNLNRFGLIEEGDDGSISGGERENEIRTFAVPVACLMLLFMLVMTSAPQLMNNILEEKMQRIAEVLVSAVSPFQLLMGKLVGAVMITLTLAVTYIGGIIWASLHYEFADLIPVSIYVWLIVMIVFALFMYGGLFSALGAACSELRDAQSMMMPAMVMVMLPMFGFSVMLENPNGTVAQILTFIPTCTPIVLLFRIASQPGPELWEIIFGLLYCVLTTWVLVWGSAKIFRIGILSQGQAPSFRKLLGWLREG
jgi:ABC-2 type transport system permease protein